MYRQLYLFIVFALLAACSIPPQAPQTPIAEVAQLPAAMVTLPDNLSAPLPGRPTSTPFLPLAPTPTYLPPEYPTPTLSPLLTPSVSPTSTSNQNNVWGSNPGPTVWPDVEILPPVDRLDEPQGQTTILLLGSDQRDGAPSFRTDTMVLLTINPALGKVSMVSFPRDIYAYIPGWTVNRINAAMMVGGFNTLAMTYEYNFGVRPDYYVLVRFAAFEEIIDGLGGIEVDVAQKLTDKRSGHGDFTVEPGLVEMDGEIALWYVRSRKTTSDFDRARRQQEVLLAIFNKLISLDALNRAPELYNAYKRNVKTDMTFEQMARFLPLAARLTDSSRIERYVVTSKYTTSYINSTGAMVLLPKRDEIRELLIEALNIP
jgi:LCP family protein required for cell wall assembly